MKGFHLEADGLLLDNVTVLYFLPKTEVQNC